MCSTVPFTPDKNLNPSAKWINHFVAQEQLFKSPGQDFVEKLGNNWGKGNWPKLTGCEASSPLGIKLISAWDHEGGPVCQDSSILVNTVARKWCVQGSPFW